MKKIMTSEQSFNVAMNEYPTLYVAPTLELAKLKHFDQLFNTIGNGFRDMDEFLNGMTIKKKNQDKINSFPEKYITSKPIYEVYTEIDDTFKYSVSGKRGSELPGLYTNEEIEKMPNVKHKMQINANYNTVKESFNIFVPYPNFQKEYSILWNKLDKLDDSWLEAGVFFYTKSKDFFNSKNVNFYHYAPPKENDKKAWKSSIDGYEERFKKYNKEGLSQEDWYNSISKAYEVEYNGNTKEFINNKWNKELLKIILFIDETLEILKIKLETRNIKTNDKIWLLIEDYAKKLNDADYWSGKVKSSTILNLAYEAQDKVKESITGLTQENKNIIWLLIEDYAKKLKDVDYWSGKIKSSTILNLAYEAQDKIKDFISSKDNISEIEIKNNKGLKI